MRSPIRALACAAALVAVAAAPTRAADHGFPGTDPSESVRVHTPNDTRFDCSETDDQDGQSCTNLFEEQFQRFGFASGTTQTTATYHNPTDPHVARLMAQNTLAGRTALGQVSGVSADRAWKHTPGDPAV